MGFVELIENAKFALEGAFGGVLIAEGEIVVLDLIGHPVDVELPPVPAMKTSKLSWARLRCHSAWAALRTKS